MTYYELGVTKIVKSSPRGLRAAMKYSLKTLDVHPYDDLSRKFLRAAKKFKKIGQHSNAHFIRVELGTIRLKNGQTACDCYNTFRYCRDYAPLWTKRKIEVTR